MIKWNASKTELDLILRIVKRAEASIPGLRRQQIVMDLEACHCNGNPLNFIAMYEAPIGDLVHDVVGISNHINRDTGQLEDSFSPRYSEVYHPYFGEGVPNDSSHS